jgi:prepilin-type N-terminal cleavage/methylation domain-containing protein
MTRRAFTKIELLVVMAIVGLLGGILVAAVQKVRDRAYAARCSNRLRQIGLALHQHHNEHQRLPPGCSYRRGLDPMPHVSWSTRLLPYMGEAALWQQAVEAFAREKLFVRPPHPGSRVMPMFLCSSDPRQVFVVENNRDWAGFTCYLGVAGTNQTASDGLLYLDSRVSFAEVVDGTGNTIMVGERPPSADGVFGWWYAGWGQKKDGSADLILGAREIATHRSFRKCPPESARYRQGRADQQCDALHFWSLHFGGAHFAFADGAVRFVSYSADLILPALATRAGNESVIPPD